MNMGVVTVQTGAITAVFAIVDLVTFLISVRPPVLNYPSIYGTDMSFW